MLSIEDDICGQDYDWQRETLGSYSAHIFTGLHNPEDLSIPNPMLSELSTNLMKLHGTLADALSQNDALKEDKRRLVAALEASNQKREAMATHSSRVDELERRARPSVSQDERQRVRMARPDMNELDFRPVDRRDELGQGVEPRLQLAPVVAGGPVLHQLLQPCQLDTLG